MDAAASIKSLCVKIQKMIFEKCRKAADKTPVNLNERRGGLPLRAQPSMELMILSALSLSFLAIHSLLTMLKIEIALQICLVLNWDLIAVNEIVLIFERLIGSWIFT